MLKKTFLTNLPPITNKGKERTSKEETKEIIIPKEATNRPTLQTTTTSNLLHRIPNIPLKLGINHSYGLTICVLSIIPMTITLISVLTWFTSNNYSKMIVNVIPTRPLLILQT